MTTFLQDVLVGVLLGLTLLAIVVAFLFWQGGRECGLCDDAASSVSNAPGP
jgi:hypothetical protein